MQGTLKVPRIRDLVREIDYRRHEEHVMEAHVRNGRRVELCEECTSFNLLDDWEY